MKAYTKDELKQLPLYLKDIVCEKKATNKVIEKNYPHYKLISKIIRK